MKKGNSVIITLLGIFGLILLFELLITFKVISLSSLSKILSPKNTKLVSPSTTPLPIAINCPAPIRPCQGKDIFKNKSYAGIGFKLKTGDPIFAAIQGDIIYKDRNSTRSSILDDAVILGKGDAKGYMAVYNFVGDKLGSELMKGISQSGVIAIASSGSLIDFQDSKGIDLILRLQDVHGRIFPLKPSDFQ